MRGARLIGLVAGAAILLGVAAAVAGCGGGSASATAATVPTGREVRHCMLEGGGHPGDQNPFIPEEFPQEAEAVNISGANADHVTLFVARRPVFTPRIAKGFHKANEYKARVLLDGRALMLISRSLTKATEDLALSCVEGRGVPAGAPSAMSTIPIASQFKQCVIEDGGKLWSKEPPVPKGFPSETEPAVTAGPGSSRIVVEPAMTIGPGSSRILAYISPGRRVFSQRIAKRFNARGEYQAVVIYGGRGLLLLASGIGKKDRRVASECVAA